MSTEHRYAKALYQLAEDAKAVPAVVAQAVALQAAVADATVAGTLADPRLSHERRQLVAVSMAKSVKAHPLLANTLGLMAANNRLSKVAGMLASFRSMADKASNTARVAVESAIPLTESQRTQLAAQVKTFTKASGVVLDEKTKPTLMGGFRAFFGGHVWDATVQGSLARLRQQLAESIRKVSND